jgi:hypothetical protein
MKVLIISSNAPPVAPNGPGVVTGAVRKARGQGLGVVLPNAGILLGFAVIFFTVGAARFRYE